jgi:hypothetical protein
MTELADDQNKFYPKHGLVPFMEQSSTCPERKESFASTRMVRPGSA